MKIALTLFFLAFLTNTHFIIAQGNTAEDSLQNIFTNLESQMFLALEAADKPAIEKLLAPDYITINADGVMESREAMLGTFGKFKGSTHTLSQRMIRVFGETAVITGKAKFYFKSILVAEVLYTELWVNHSGSWLFTGWQGTMTGAPSHYPLITTAIIILLLVLLVGWLIRRIRRRRLLKPAP